MRFLKIKKGDQFFIPENGENLTAKFYDDYRKDFVFECSFYDCTKTDDDDNCSGDCDLCFFYKERTGESRLTTADLHRRGIGVNCTIIFDEE